MINKNCLKLYGITDDKFNRPDTIAQMVEEAIIGGSTIIQFRSKALSSKEKETCAKTVLNITRKYKVPLIIDSQINRC